MKNRLKKYKNLRYGMKFLTFKREYLKNPLVSPTNLALQIYDCQDVHSANSIATENLSKLGLTLTDLMNRHHDLSNIDDLNDLQRLSHAKKFQDCDVFIKDENGKLKINKNSNDFIEVDDNQVQAKILELRLKLKGYLRESQINIGAEKQIVLVMPKGTG